jgi:hypothetical protein
LHAGQSIEFFHESFWRFFFNVRTDITVKHRVLKKSNRDIRLSFGGWRRGIQFVAPVLQPQPALVHRLSSLSLLSFSSLPSNFKASLHQLFPLSIVHELDDCFAVMDRNCHLDIENGVVDVAADESRHKFR